MYVVERVMTYVLELKDPRWVLGYGSREIEIAVERGKADAVTTSLTSLLRERPDWIEKGFTIPVVWGDVGSFASITKTSGSLEKYADTELKRAVL